MHRLSLRVVSVVACSVACLVSPVSSWPTWRQHWRSGRPGHGHDSGSGHGHDSGSGHDDDRNFKTISNIYNLTVYPHQVPIILGGAAGVPPGLFSQNVSGRVDPVGDFVGFEDSIEYFFALAPLPQGNVASAAITSYKIAEFSSACLDVAASVTYLYTSVVNPGSPDNGKALAPLKQVSARVRSTIARYDLCQLTSF